MFKFVRTMLAVGSVIAIGSPAFAVPPVSDMQITVSPSSIAPGDSAVVTGTVLPNDGSINCGEGKIQYNIIHADLTETDYQNLADNLTVTANQFSATFDTSIIPVVVGDTVRFRAGYNTPGNPAQCGFDIQPIGQSPTTDLLIVGGVCPDGQTTGVFISIEGPSGNGIPAPGDSGPWSFTVKVKACEDVYNVTAQGGANGWAPIKTYAPSTGSVTPYVKNKNTVYLWDIGNLVQGQDEELEVTVDATIKNSRSECGKVKTLNGDWSALFATTDGGAKTKSAYTTYKSTITVTCP